MSRTKNDLTAEAADRELEMTPGADIPKPDDFDPGQIFGLGNALPELPRIPGYHCAWAPVATDVIRDNSRWIAMYRMGFRPIKVEEFATYGLAMVGETYRERENPEFVDCVRVMDVVAVKIPQPLYDKIEKFLQDQVQRTEADLKKRPAQMRNVPYADIQVEHRSGASHDVQSAYDRL